MTHAIHDIQLLTFARPAVRAQYSGAEKEEEIAE